MTQKVPDVNNYLRTESTSNESELGQDRRMFQDIQYKTLSFI